MANAAYLLLVSFLVAIPSILQNYHVIDIAEDQIESSRNPNYVQNQTETFDFIVIGAGSAGAVVANRLSKYKHLSVLVLDRGGDPSPFSAVPYLWLYLAYVDPGSFAKYVTTPQIPYARATNGLVTLIGGSVLGGTSTLNMMVYTRGNSRVYDEWAKISGDRDWRYENILPYFKKFENYHGTFSHPLDRAVHSTGGELTIEAPYEPQPSVQIFLNAIREKNLPIKDLNADQTAGFQPIDFNVKRGHRAGTFEAFLEPILERENLNIYRYATATKIHFDQFKKAVGVSYTRHGKTHYVKARKEVIVSAGVYESPKLLMLSGIGPKADLQAVGVTPFLDLPVGQNLQDHLGINLQVNINKNITFVPERDITLATYANYIRDGTGPLHNIFSVLGYITSVENNDADFPDIQYFISHQSYPVPDPNSARNDSNAVVVYLVKPKSVGYLKLNSSDPTVPPIVNPNYGKDPEDMRRLVEGIKWIVNLYENSDAYRDVGAQLAETSFTAACQSYAYRSDPWWNCLAEFGGTAGFHLTGTCSMGTVVDSKLRVKGVSGLRVADTSIMPVVPNGNTNVPAMMVGEKAAAMILKSLGLIGIIEQLAPSH